METRIFVTTHPFTYGDLGQPAVVAPSTIEFGEEQIVLVSLPGVSAIQTLTLRVTALPMSPMSR